MIETTTKKLIGVLDFTPTWTVAAQIISMAITSESDEARNLAAKEVERMGSIIDELSATIERLKEVAA